MEFYVIPRFDSEEDMRRLPPEKRWGEPISLHQITNRLQINTEYGEQIKEFDSESLLDSNDIEGAIKLSINGRCVLDINQSTYNLVHLVGALIQKIIDINLELIKIRSSETDDREVEVEGSYPSIYLYSYSFRVPVENKNSLVASYHSKERKGEEILDRIEFSRLFLMEAKRFYDKMVLLFPEERDFTLHRLEMINFVRGYLLCEELNQKQNP